MLNAQNQVSTDTLAVELDVSRETVRRDLLELESDGRIKRIHGGAVLPHPTPEEPFKERMGRHLREKQEIAKLAATMIKPGQCVLVDAGTTTSVFAQELIKIPDILVITNSIHIVNLAYQFEHKAEVLLLGGRMVSDVPATYGELTLTELSRFQADMAIMSPVALHPEQGAAAFDLHEAELARAMISQASKLMMLCNHGKLDMTSRIQYCSTDQIDILVTDGSADKDTLHAFSKNGIKKIATTKTSQRATQKISAKKLETR